MTGEILPSLQLGRTLALVLPISFIPYCSPGGRHVWEATLDALSATMYAVHLLFRSTKRKIEAGGHYSFQSCVRHPQTASAPSHNADQGLVPGAGMQTLVGGRVETSFTAPPGKGLNSESKTTMIFQTGLPRRKAGPL